MAAPIFFLYDNKKPNISQSWMVSVKSWKLVPETKLQSPSSRSITPSKSERSFPCDELSNCVCGFHCYTEPSCNNKGEGNMMFPFVFLSNSRSLNINSEQTWGFRFGRITLFGNKMSFWIKKRRINTLIFRNNFGCDAGWILAGIWLCYLVVVYGYVTYYFE